MESILIVMIDMHTKFQLNASTSRFPENFFMNNTMGPTLIRSIFFCCFRNFLLKSMTDDVDPDSSERNKQNKKQVLRRKQNKTKL